jgi:L-rhamnose mutarotase
LVLASFAFNDAAENWNDYMPDVLWREGIDQNNDAVRRIAARFNLPVVPFEEYARTHDEVFMDSIHMTAAGNQKMAAVFADSLMPLIMKIERK